MNVSQFSGFIIQNLSLAIFSHSFHHPGRLTKQAKKKKKFAKNFQPPNKQKIKDVCKTFSQGKITVTDLAMRSRMMVFKKM
jgi:hypothetical protein